eukprot:TRINITY_DN7780_c0_g1_i1.p1 TRINITY_DN7780_c0_g1~~TRINITY_DN7780_c0_g1_i1.p1  ORF type:complete len:451 (-),score=103.03 TRINITY_DN7780_c0_g1_i1:126-1478(-)
MASSNPNLGSMGDGNKDEDTKPKYDGDDHATQVSSTLTTQQNTDTITMPELLRIEHSRQQKAAKILESPSVRRCTYSMGYVHQPLYVCRTCTEKSDSEDMFALCHGCSIFCHANHELIDIWDKRNFRCDCGNSKNAGFVCELEPNKDPVNERNKYNHNFSGRYCWCDEPEVSDDDDMYKCIVCEDWFHKAHIQMNTDIPDNLEDEDEYMCRDCAEKLPFLRPYTTICAKEKHESAAAPDCEDAARAKSEKKEESSASDTSALPAPTEEIIHKVTEPKMEVVDVVKTEVGDSELCKLKRLHEPLRKTSRLGKDLKLCIFWKKDWRRELCQCSKCLSLYAEHSVSFLVDPNDSPIEVGDPDLEESLEAQDEAEETEAEIAAEQDPRQMIDDMLDQFISAMPPERQRLVMYGVRQMREILYAKLEEVQSQGRAVSPDDIKHVFESLGAKRPRI